MREALLRRTWRAGFTMVELMVVIAVAVILLGVGVPSWRAFVQRQKVTATANEFFAAINLTRSEAIRRGMRVDLMPVDPAGDWAKGWMVFVDENSNRRRDAAEKPIFTHDTVPPGISIDANLTDSQVQYLAYTGTGRTRTNASGERTQFGNFTFRVGDQIRRIKLNFLGRARLCDPDTDRTC